MKAQAERTSLGEFPEYATATAKLSELEKQLEQVRLRQREIQGDLTTHTDRGKDDTRTVIRTAADHLLSTGKLTAVQGAASVQMRLEAELARLRDDEAVLKAAIGKQADTVNQLRDEYSLRVCKECEGRHRELLQQIVRNMIPLCVALKARTDFEQELQSGGVDFEYRLTVPFPINLGNPLPTLTRILPAYLEFCVSTGVIAPREIPTELRSH